MFVSSWLKNLALCTAIDLPDFQEQNIFVTSGLLTKMIELGAVKIFRGKVATTAKTNASRYSRFSWQSQTESNLHAFSCYAEM